MENTNQTEKKEEFGNFRNHEEQVMLVDEKTNEPVGQCSRKEMR